jgi:flagellin
MASSIALSSGMRQNLAALQLITDQQETQQLRLATGKKVNSAIDNPASFFTSQGLGNRASDLNSLLDSIGQATKVLEAADKGITALTNLVQSAQGSARQALQSTSTTSKVVGSGTNLTGSTNLTTGLGFTAAKTITVGDGTLTKSFTLTATDTVDSLITAINTDTTLNGANAATTGKGSAIRASLNSDGTLQIEALNVGKTATISTNDVTAAFGKLVGTTVAAGGTSATATTAATANTSRTSLAAQFDALRTQIDQLAKDSGYNGTNLLDSGSLKVQFNETNSSSVTVSGVKFSSTGLGVSASTNSFQTDTDINDALTNLGNALTSLRSQASTFGSNLAVVQTRQDFTKSLISTLQTGGDSLVLADQNEEAAKLVTLNTRQQLANTALSLANQSQQGVLRLF